MKSAVILFASTLLAAAAALGGAAEQREADLKQLSTDFWKAVTEGAFDNAKKSIFTYRDDPELGPADLLAKAVADSFLRVTKRIKGKKGEFLIEETRVAGGGDLQPRQTAGVTVMFRIRGDGQLLKLWLAWLETEGSGWRIVDLRATDEDANKPWDATGDKPAN